MTHASVTIRRLPRTTDVAVIPALDESSTIGAVVAQLRESAPRVDIVVVDDGSRDATAMLAHQAGATVVRHSFTLGYGAALQTGYLYAVRGGYERCVQLDADGQHDASLVPVLLETLSLQNAHVVIASRALAGTQAASWLRGLGTGLLRSLGRALAGVETSDPTSGFRALDRRALTLLANEFPDDYPDLDVLILMRYAGLRVVEIPGASLPRRGGRSMHSGMRPAYYLYKVTLAAILATLRGRRHAAGIVRE